MLKFKTVDWMVLAAGLAFFALAGCNANRMITNQRQMK